MHWVYLIAAGLFETFWAVSLKMSHGFSRVFPTIMTVVGMAISFYLLSKALKFIPLGMGYAVWTGIGAVGTFVASIILFHDSCTIGQGLCVLLIIAGIVGLRLLSPSA